LLPGQWWNQAIIPEILFTPLKYILRNSFWPISGRQRLAAATADGSRRTDFREKANDIAISF
jgi:hypothetical protein